MKKIHILVVLLMSGTAFAQQESQFITSINNPFQYNPAAGGLASAVNIELASRLQWVGFGQGPTTFNLMANSVIGIGNSAHLQELENDKKFLGSRPEVTVGALKHVVGGQVYSDQIGVFQTTKVQANYAIHLPVTKEFNVGAGLGLGWHGNSINDKRVVIYDATDEVYTNALANGAKQNMLGANFGLVFYGKGLFVGASFSQLFNNKAKFHDFNLKSRYQPHYYVNLAYAIRFGMHAIEPAVVLKATAKAPVSVDFGARYIYNNAAWFGVYGRTGNAVAFQLGANLIKNIYISYAYDYTFGRLVNAKSGTHEINFGVYIGKPKAVQKIDKSSEKGSE